MGNDEDDPATMTGPSYRMTGPINRGTDRRRPPRVAQAAGDAKVSSGSDLKSIVATAETELEKASKELVIASLEQTAADRLVDELLPHFTAEFSGPGRSGKPYNSKIGNRIPVRVVSRADIVAEKADQAQFLWRQEYDVMFREAFDLFEKKFQSRQRDGLLYGAYSRIPRSLGELDHRDAITIRPIVGGAPPAGFFHDGRQTLFLAVGQLSAGLVAHELCHAYAARAWNHVQTLMHVWDLGIHSRGIDEGITSSLADLVIGRWMSSSFGAKPTSALPSGYHGYGPDVRRQARHFLDIFEGPGRAPGHITKAGYFGGRVGLSVDRKRPLASTLTLAGRAMALSKVVS